MEVQYITNAVGEHTAVVIPIDEWYGLTAKYPEVANDVDSVPQWQKDFIDGRLAHLAAHPKDVVTGEAFTRELKAGMDDEF